MDVTSKAIIESKQEFMVSPTGENPVLKISNFISPILKSSKDPALQIIPNSFFSETTPSVPRNLSLEVSYTSWLNPHDDWKQWIERLHSDYQNIWKSAGIYEAIRGSAYRIGRHDELILELVKKWFPVTNTFIFSWGEATITLEDLMVYWGYSVLGCHVFTPLETQEMKETETRLLAVRRKLVNTPAKRADHKPWLRHFMNNDKDLEHEGFLVFWLSRFVFPGNSRNSIVKENFPLAIHLARGTRIALAPTLLANIYRDLTLFKKDIDSAMEFGVDKNSARVSLCAPFQIVQVWAMERFQALDLNPKEIEQGQPMIARWDNLKFYDCNVSLALNSPVDLFNFRPYINSFSFKFYCEREKLISLDTNSSDEELVSFARCIRACKLMGIDCCIEKYNPQRVAMQFGMDLDVPGWFDYPETTPFHCWTHYDMPIMGDLYIASKTSKPMLSSRYHHWWQLFKLSSEEPVKKSQRATETKKTNYSSKEHPQATPTQVEHHGPQEGNSILNIASQRSTRSLMMQSSKALKISDDANVPTGLARKALVLGDSSDGGSNCKRVDNCINLDKVPGFLIKRVACGDSIEEGSMKEDNEVDAPPGFRRKCSYLSSGNLDKELMPETSEGTNCGGLSSNLKAETNMDTMVNFTSEASIRGLKEAIEDTNGGGKESSMEWDWIYLSSNDEEDVIANTWFNK